MSLNFCYEDTPPTGTLRRITDQARQRRLKFYGRMKTNWYTPPTAPRPTPIAEVEPVAPLVIGRLPCGFHQTPVIQKFVAFRYGLTREELLCHDTSYKFAHPRHVAVFFTREFTTHSLPGIGRNFGGRDHTTITHSLEWVAALIASDLIFALEIEEMRAGLKDILS